MKDLNIAIIGAGAMGGAVARRLIDTGLDAKSLRIANPHVEKVADLASAGALVTTDNIRAAEGAEVVIIAVKPWILPQVVTSLKDALDYKHQHVAVIVAGITGDDLCTMFDKGGRLPLSLNLVMPNTAMSVGRSMTFIVNLHGCDDVISEIFAEAGSVMTIEERLLPAATALASCGIAYALRYVRAAVEGGVELGFRASDAQNIVAQTLIGAAALLASPGAHAESEIDKVTTPGGLTIRGLNAMEANGFTNAVIAGLKASVKQ